MRYRVLRGFCLGGGVDLLPGELVELTDNRLIREMVERGRITPAPPPPPPPPEVAPAPAPRGRRKKQP